MSKKGTIPVKKSFLEQILLLGIVLVFLVLPVLYFPGRVASYVTSKQYFLIGAVDVLTVVWVWLLSVDARYRLSKKNLLYLSPLFLFLLSLTVSALVGVDSARSFFSTIESGTGLILLYHIFLFTCIVASVIRVRQQKFLKYIFQATLLASVVLAVSTFYTGVHGLIDINSVMLDSSNGGAMMGNSLLAGAYFIFSIFFTLYLITHESRWWKKIFYWLGLAVIIFSPIYFNVAIFKGAALSSSYLIFGEARVATVAMIFGIILAAFIYCWVQKRSQVWRTIGIIGIGAMIVLTAIGVQQIATANTKAHTFFIQQSGNRTIDWQEAVQGIKEKPAIGWGMENYHVVFQKYFDPAIFGPNGGNEAWNLHPHNNTLEVLVNGGVIGFLFYLLVLASLFFGLFKLYKQERIDGKTFALLMGMLIAFIIQQQMVYDSIVSYMFFFFAIAIVAGLSDTPENPHPIKVYNSSAMYMLGTAIVVVMFPVWLYAAYLPAQKVTEFQHITDVPSDQRGALYQHLFHSSGSYAIDTDVEFFTDPLFYSYGSQEQVLKANPRYQQVASQEVQSLITAVDPIWQKEYYNYHLTLSLIELENLDFYLTGDTAHLAQADAYAVRGFTLSPTDPQIYTTYAETRVYEKNLPAAKELVTQALALAPTYPPALTLQNLLK